MRPQHPGDAQLTDDLLTTRQAAALLGVGTTSVKRWSDTGVLPCIKTPGGHRRIPRGAVQALLRSGLPAAVESGGDDGTVAHWVRLLVEGHRHAEVEDRLLVLRDEVGAWWRVAERIVPVLVEIGERWSAGELSVLEEHLASERLARALARCAAGLEVPADSSTALLVAADGDEHTLGLSLVELCLREAGWNTRWSGRSTPFEAVRRFVSRHGIELIALSASVYSRDANALAEMARRYGGLCEERGIELLIGGAGRWPEELDHGRRVSSIHELATVLASLPPMSH